MSFDGLGGSENWNSVNVGDGASTSEGNGDVGGADVVGKFGDGQNVEAS